MTQITDHLAKVRERVAAAARSVGRSADDVTILAVSKSQPIAAIRAAYDSGQRVFGENLVQEALSKIDALTLEDIKWHFIGRVQSNKTRDIARCFDWVHTVDRLKIARRLNDQRPHYATPLNVCIQVNISEEPQKGGIAARDVQALAGELRALPRLRLRGLMAIPAIAADTATLVAVFDELRALKNRLDETGFDLDTLSMGMSKDFELAVRHGSTIVRVGSAIFGPRPHA